MAIKMRELLQVQSASSTLQVLRITDALVRWSRKLMHILYTSSARPPCEAHVASPLAK